MRLASREPREARRARARYRLVGEGQVHSCSSRGARREAQRELSPLARKISGFFAWLFWIFLHIFWLIGFRNRFVVMSEWAWAYFSLQRRVRLITGEHDATTGAAPPLVRR